MSSETPIDLNTVRRRLEGNSGRRFWKSLEELTRSAGFEQFLEREFPENAATWSDPAGRRDFLRLMGASLALAGLTGCTRQPEERILPYAAAPEQLVPGQPLFFATSLPQGGYARGVLVESHMGRPTKIEGNPQHPASLGATDLFAQAEVLELYDPDRSKTLKERGEIRSWSAFVAAMQAAMQAQRALGGAGLRILTETVTSPTLAAQLDELLAELPAAKWHQYEPTGRDTVRAGARLAFGEPVETQLRLDQADVIVSLDADFIGLGPANVRHMRAFTARRPARDEAPNRLYVIESSPSLTGAAADHRLPVRPSAVQGLARALARGIGLDVAGASDEHADWIQPLVRDLERHAGSSVVIAGDCQPAEVHALVHAVNQRLGNVGRTVVYTDPVEARPVDQAASLGELVRDMHDGSVDLLLILGGNPVYTCPADVAFVEALKKVPLRVHAGLHEDETAEHCHWHVPLAHPLESWSDLRAFDGSVSLVQPLIAPLYGSKCAHEILAALGPRPESKGHDIVREHWRSRLGSAGFEDRWRRALHDGVLADTAFPEKTVTLRPGPWLRTVPPRIVPGLELTFRPDPTLGDGRHANNGWLQELPKALTHLTWDNAAWLSPRTAEQLGVRVHNTSRGTPTDVLELSYGGRTLEAPAWIVPGHPDDVVTVHLGHGRRRAGRVGNGVGFDAYRLRTLERPWFGPGLQVRRSGERVSLACTQDHWTIEHEEQVRERALVRQATLEEYRQDPHFAAHQGHTPDPALTLYPDHAYEGHAWGMTIDLNTCLGCNACVVACQAENNIPVVGREQVAMGREMHWLRIDRYHSGGLDNPETHHQPVPCMHCENAPCEVVCPVAATVHSDEGLNDMVYNRCVGTRYCANNCPYKVRRFNFFLYADWETESFKLQRNPDVTVRSRGVMEKCTYCVQRINQVRIDARREQRPVRDGEIRTACEGACPTRAITFGDVNDPHSRVARAKADPRNYGLLEELNTRPRTTYLAAVKNPNPEMPRG